MENNYLVSNINGVHNILELLRNYRQKNSTLPTLIHFSTDEVYGDIVDGAHTETDILKPSNPYSATKAAADQLVESAGRTYGLPYLITRTCNNFGEHQHSEKFLPTIYRSIMEGNPIPLYGDGGHVREWIWVDDNVRLVYNLFNCSYRACKLRTPSSIELSTFPYFHFKK